MGECPQNKATAEIAAELTLPPQYTKAIETDPTVAAYWGNRAYAYILSEANGAAVQDAEKAIQLDRSYVKA